MKIRFADCTWLNEPKQWSLDGDLLSVRTDARTDFWRETHYGFIHDNGHFLAAKVTEGFTAQLRFRANYTHLYDQAGLMVRIDAQTWMKAGIEFTGGRPSICTVVTSDKSDWSIASLEGDPRDVRVRVTVREGALRVQASTDGHHWPLFRLAPFPASQSYSVGPICCSPERDGFEVEFLDFDIAPPISKHLHDST